MFKKKIRLNFIVLAYGKYLCNYHVIVWGRLFRDLKL